MKFVKYHISVILPIFLLLFSVESFFVLNKVIKDYEKRLNSQYSIVVVSKAPLDKDALIKDIGYFASIKLIDTDKMVGDLKKSIGDKNYQKLKSTLPLFYSIRLKHLPKEGELNSIKKRLLGYIGVQKVVTFKKSYSKFYNFLLFDKTLLQFFTFLTLVIVLLLIIKQSEVWIYEHRQRFEIMSILGAPFWMKSAMLYRVVIFDAIISALMVTGIFFYLPYDVNFVAYIKDMGITYPIFSLWEDSLKLMGFGMIISVVSVTFAILQLNKER